MQVSFFSFWSLSSNDDASHEEIKILIKVKNQRFGQGVTENVREGG